MGRAHEVRKAAMAKTAAKKTKLYSYYGKEIYLAAKAGGPEPDGNLSLRRLIEKAKTNYFNKELENTLEMHYHCIEVYKNEKENDYYWGRYIRYISFYFIEKISRYGCSCT